MPASEKRNQGKGMFVKEWLNDHPHATTEAVNAAWRDEGHSGNISPSLVSNVRSRMGLAGNTGRGRRGKKSTSPGRRRERPAGAGPARANGTAPTTGRKRGQDLMGLEVELDRLLMKVVEVGQLPEVEASLRKARRHLYADLTAAS
ncbi:MAG: hypothetical protein ACYC61_18415 [Isosphaeraceae bacterium]